MKTTMKTRRQVLLWLATCGYLLWAASASAFYNSQVGRWLNRDPIASEVHTVTAPLLDSAFVKNHPVQSFDILGLLTDDEKKAACREAWKEDQARKPEERLLGGHGTTICVGKEVVGCVWAERTKGWAAEMDACAQAHEDSHVADIQKLQAPYGCASDTRCEAHYKGEPNCKKCSKFYVPTFENAYAAKKASECTAFKAMFNCMAQYANTTPKPEGWRSLARVLDDAAKKCPGEFPGGKVVWPK